MSEVNLGSHKIKIAKPSTSSAKNRKNKSLSIEALKATIEKKKEATARALGIVVRFSEGVVTEQCLLENAYYLNQCHFQDITEERAILKLCGYPICGNKLKDIPKKQYHISTTQNKVFDITDRKNFCSNLCYKASKFLQDQLLTSPLWLRDNDEHISFKLLPHESRKGISGIEVDIGLKRVTQAQIEKTEDCRLLEEFTNSVSKLSHEVEDQVAKFSNYEEEAKECEERSFISNQCGTVYESVSYDAERGQNSNSNTDERSIGEGNTGLPEDCDVNSVNKHVLNADRHFAFEHDKTVDKKCDSYEVSKCLSLLDSVTETKSKNKDNIKLNDKKEITHNERSERKQVVHSHSESVSENIILLKEGESKVRNKTKTQRIKRERKSKNIPNDEAEPVLNIVMKIEYSIREWITIDSLCFIYGVDKVKELLADKGTCIKDWHNTCGSTVTDPYLYERYLAICRKLNVLEVEDSRVDTEVISENCKLPQKPLPDYELLLEESKNIELKVKQFYKGDKKVTFEEASAEGIEGNSRVPVLPLVDLHAQRSLRRRIVLDKLSRVLNDVVRLLGLKGFDIYEEVRTLVSTFTLSAHNITFRPLEWNLIALAIIKLLSIKDEALAETLNSATVIKHLTLMLMSYQVDGGYLDRLTDWLTDIEHTIKKSSEEI